MIKPLRLVLLIAAFFLVVFFLLVAIYFKVFAIGFVLFLAWIYFVFYTFCYNQIIINDDSLKFRAVVREKVISFDNLKNANNFNLGTGFYFSVNGKISIIPISSKTKDGLIKIISLSEKISEKEREDFISKINKITHMLE